VAPLFARIDHSVPIVFSVLERSASGRVFVDRPEHPRSAFVTVTGAFSYVAGDANAASFGRDLVRLVFDDLLPHQEEQELVLFAFTDAWRAELDYLLGSKGAIRIPRKTFSFDGECVRDFRSWRSHVPAGYRIEPLRVEPGDPRFGVQVLKGDDVISTCRAIFVGRGEAEIDVHTKETHRNRGLGTFAASVFLEACLARGLRPNWSCWPQRQASVALAKTLGFVEKADVPAHLWVPSL
jgi:RimJ/RimL family protein N-acetyltransferase